jgi:hypothetical protein
MPTAELAPPVVAQPADAKTTVMGPLITSSGFKFWYFVCDAESIIAVPQPFMDGFLLSMQQNAYAALMFGLIGGALSAWGKSKHDKLVAELQGRPNRLKYAPNQSFRISQLRSIQAKTSLKGAGGLGTSDIILERSNGMKMAFGSQPAPFRQYSEQLKQLYPAIYSGK